MYRIDKIIIRILSITFMIFPLLLSCSQKSGTKSSTLSAFRIYSVAIEKDKRSAYDTALILLAAQKGGLRFAISKNAFATKAKKVNFRKEFTTYYKKLPSGEYVCVMSTLINSIPRYGRHLTKISRKIPLMAFADDNLREKMFNTLLSIMFKNKIRNNTFVKGYMYITYFPDLRKVDKMTEKIVITLKALH